MNNSLEELSDSDSSFTYSLGRAAELSSKNLPSEERLNWVQKSIIGRAAELGSKNLPSEERLNWVQKIYPRKSG